MSERISTDRNEQLLKPVMGMNRRQFTEAHKAFCESIIEITTRKNHDYTGADSDPFANFKNVQVLGICTVEQGFLTRMTDKMSRLAGFCKNGVLKVANESIIDTLKDLANYAILKAIYLQSLETVLEDDVNSTEGEKCDDEPSSPEIMVQVPKAFLQDVHDTTAKAIGFLNRLDRGVLANSDGTKGQLNREKDYLARIAAAAAEYKYSN